jgi:hypothetical protein
MSNIEVEELLKVLEAIRAEKHPSIPPGLIRSIVESQFENQDDRAQGRRDTKNLIDDFLKQVVAES